jgi:hypothetical protein
MPGGGLIQLVAYGASGMYLELIGNPQVSFFAGGTSKKLLHPELYTADIRTPFNPRTDDVLNFPKEKYCGPLVYKYDEPILKHYGDSRYSNEKDHLTPFKVRGVYLKDAFSYTPGDVVEEVFPYDLLS